MLAGCGSAGWGSAGGGGGADTINVLMVNNSQMVDLQKLTADNFTAKTGIRVNFTVLPENDVRDKISQEFSSQAGQYDVATVSNFEIPIYARSKWIAPLSDHIAKDTAFDQDDILKPMTESLSKDGVVYGEPFYGESSFLMYRKDVLDSKGITMPANPTWDQVADIAAKVDGAQPNMKGICLRGQPGWGPDLRPTHDGGEHLRWHLVREGLDARGQRPAVRRRDELLRQASSRSTARRVPPRPGFTECLNNLVQGTVAMWYDATSAPGSLEAADSPVKGKIGYVAAPVKLTKSSGWLYSWAVGHPDGQHQEGQRLEVRVLGVEQGVRGAGRPAARLVQGPGRQALLDLRQPRLPQGRLGVRDADQGRHRVRRPEQPGVQPRPAPGIQFIDIPSSPTSAPRSRRTSARRSPAG
jgi:sorbitol/mannitol transport system substrate-binding protein